MADPDWLVQARAEGRILSERSAKMPTEEKTCPDCNGSGHDNVPYGEKCDRCKGTGKYVAEMRKPKKKRTFATGKSASWAVILRPACRVISEANEREHWAPKGRRRKEQQEAVNAVLERSPVHCKADTMWRLSLPLTVTFIHSGSRMDDDNLAGAFKGCRDCIAAYIGLDDGDPRWTWKYEQRLETVPAKYGIEIRIEPTGA